MHANLGRRAHACIHSTLSLLLIHTQSTWLLLTGPNSTPHGSTQGIGCKNIQQPWTPCQQQATLQHSQAQLKSRGATPPANTSTTFPKAFHPDRPPPYPTHSHPWTCTQEHAPRTPKPLQNVGSEPWRPLLGQRVCCRAFLWEQVRHKAAECMLQDTPARRQSHKHTQKLQER